MTILVFLNSIVILDQNLLTLNIQKRKYAINVQSIEIQPEFNILKLNR